MMKLGKNQEAWLKALESGEYKQAIETLNDGVGFCCLGVACEISGISEWNGASYGGCAGDPPKTVGYWLGLCLNGCPSRHAPNYFRSLQSMNDSGSSFKEIATHLRKHPEVYFSESK